MHPNGCHNRAEYARTTLMQDGWRTTRDVLTGQPRRDAILVEVPFRMSPRCEYTDASQVQCGAYLWSENRGQYWPIYFECVANGVTTQAACESPHAVCGFQANWCVDRGFCYNTDSAANCVTGSRYTWAYGH